MQSKTMKAKAQSLSLNQCNSAERKELRCNERLKKKKKKELNWVRRGRGRAWRWRRRGWLGRPRGFCCRNPRWSSDTRRHFEACWKSPSLSLSSLEIDRDYSFLGFFFKYIFYSYSTFTGRLVLILLGFSASPNSDFGWILLLSCFDSCFWKYPIYTNFKLSKWSHIDGIKIFHFAW